MAIEADLQLRLAELYMRRAKSDRFFELNRESDFAVKLAPQRLKKASSKRMVRTAVGIYDYIQRKFPNYDKIDVVVFNNAFARQQLGDDSHAEKLYWKVIKSYKYSNLIPDSHLAIGEMAFRQKKFAHALEHFEAIKKYPQSRVYPYGLYKAAWTQYNLRRTMVAMKELEKVVAYGKEVEAQHLDARLDLRKEALSDMALFYGEILSSKSAYAYFEKQAKHEEIGDLILKLARIYDRHSMYKDKDIVLRDYIDENPKDKIVPEIFDQLVWNYEKMKDRSKTIAQLNKFFELCSADSSWSRSQKLDKKLKYEPDCISKVRKSSLRLSEKWLALWKKNQSYPEFADSAEMAFEIFLRDNPPRAKTNKARFAYAQLLFQRDKWRKASENYDLVGRATQQKELGHNARYAAILSLEKAVSSKKKKSKETWSDKDEKRLDELVSQYVTHHRAGRYRLDVEFKRALVAYEKSNYKVAGPIFYKLGETYSRAKKGLKAQDLYLDILNQNKDYSGLKKYSKKLLTRNKSMKKRMLKIQGIYEQSYFLEVQSTEEGGKLNEAIKGYKKFANSNPKSPLAEKAWWNAVQLHFKLNDFVGGAKAAQLLYKKFPKSKNAVSALLRSAQSYEAMGQLTEAADVLQQLSRIDQKSKWKWLSLAADFLVLKGDISKARQIYGELTQSKEPNLAFHGVSQLEKLDSKSKSHSARHEKLLKEIITSKRQPQASLAQLYFVDKAYEAKDYKSAFSEAMKLLRMNSNSSIYANSKARLIQARVLEDEYQRQSVKSHIDRFTTVFAIKTEKLQKAQKAYQDVVRYGDPSISIQSMEALSKLYTSYVNLLKNMPIPRGLQESEVPAFKAEMNKLGFPLEEKGVDTMAEALNQAKKLRLHDGSIPRVQHELDLLNMKNGPSPFVQVDEPPMVVPTAKGAGV